MLFVIHSDKLPRACVATRLVSLVFFWLLCCSLVHGQSTSISLVQHANKDAGTTTSSTLAFSANNTAGNWIAVVVRAGKSSEVFTVSDSRGNSYRQAVQMNVTVDTPLGDTLAIFYAENIQGGANTITVSDTITNASLRFAILEYAGVALANSIDGTGSAQGTSATPSSGTFTSTSSGDLVLGAIITADGRTYTAGSGFATRDSVPAAPGTKLIVEDRLQPAAGAASASATLNTSSPWGAVVAAFRAGPTSPQPDLRLTNTHGGAFIQGQTGATYTLTVSNSGSVPSVGTVTVTDTLPVGLTATGISGANWNCTLAALSCTRSDALAAGAGYPPIILTVNVASNAPASVTNTALVSGGGDLNTSNNAASDVTSIGSVGSSDLRLTKTHGGAFIQGQTGATYTLTVSNSGSVSSAGTVTVTDTLPVGLTATGISGANWNCTLATLSCTRSDALAAGAGYPPVILTVNVASNAPASVTNTALVSGGGELNTSNNAASDVTPIGTGTSSDTQQPTAPGSLTATAASGIQINLNWTAATDNVGVTSYRVEQCQGAGCTVFTQIAQVDAAPAGAGPLTASANPNYFKDASGTPLILNGSHTWNNLQDWGSNGSLQTLDFNAYVDFLVAHGHNFTLLWYVELPKFCNLPTSATSPPDFTVGPHPWQRTGPGNATDGALKFDLTKFNQAYFDRLRARVQALNNAGIYVGVYTFTAEWIGAYRCATDGYPFTGANNVNGINDGGGTGSFTMTSPNAITAIQDAYVEKVVDTLNDFPNVLWIVSEEAPTNSSWWNAHQISHIRAYEFAKPNRHPIGYAAQADLNYTPPLNSDADWIAAAWSVAPTTTCGSGTPACKVNVNDSDHSYYGMWNSSAQANRNFAWENFTNGNQVMFMDPYVVNYPREGRNSCPSPINGICAGPDPRWDNFRDNLGYILRYSRKLNLANVTPRSSLCSTSNCLAQTPSVGAEYLIYAPNGGSFTVNLSAMSSSRTLNVEWFNPSTGATIVASSIPAGSASRSFTPPFSGDAVLYLVDSVGHAGAVPLPTSYSVTGLAAGAYGYRVRATDGAGNLGPYSNVATSTIQSPDTQPPTAPSGLTAATPGTGQITLGWTGSTDNVGVTGYLVERCQGVGCTTFTQVAAPVGTGTTLSDVGLAASTSYTYRVRATDAASNPGPYSNIATATTLSAPTGITLVQHANKDAGTTTSSTLAFSANNTAGNWIAVVVRAGKSSEVFTVSDSRGNTYRQAVQMNVTVDTPLGDTLAIFYAENIQGGANTITVSDTITNASLRFAILEYAGVALANSIDGTGSAQGTSATPSSGTFTSTSSGDLVLGAIITADGRTYTAGSGFATRDSVPAAPGTKLIVEDRLQPAAGAASASATLNTSSPWGAVVAAFRAAPGGSGGLPVVSVTPSGLTFGSQTTNTTSNPQMVTLTNTGVTSLTVNNIAVLGAQSADFTQGNSCGTTLPAGNSCFISITFTPHATGARVATLTISDNAPGSPHTISLAGTGSAGISPTPKVGVLTPNQTQQFTASVSGAVWSVDGVNGGTTTSGTITAAGLYTAPTSAGTHTVTATTADQLQSGNAIVYVSAYAGMFTHHNDNARTGQNLNETVLSPANVTVGAFGKLFSYQLDGVAHASPLYVAGVNIPGVGVRNVVYVATEHNSVYAFDADGRTSTPLWKVSFINSAAGVTTVPANDTGECCDIAPEIGITSTPVIDQASGTIYLVAKTKEVSGGTTRYIQRLHALDITTGAEKFGGPMQIQAGVPGTGVGSQGGQLSFDPLRQNQRPALLLSNGVVYLAFGSHGDNQPYHGWLLGYHATTLQQVMALCVTPNGEGGGIWMSNGGPATDSSGNIYFSTGDGSFDVSTRAYGDSLVKINPVGTVLDYFTPSNQATLDSRDTDFGAGGILLLPDQPGTHPHLAITAGKNATIHLIDRDSMGHFNAAGDSQIVQSLPNIFPLGTPEPGNYSAPVYFKGSVYFSPVADAVKAFQLTNGSLTTSPSSQSSVPFAYRGGALAISANGIANGILWAVEGPSPTTPGVLHAYDPSSLAIELYNSNQAGTRDALGVAGTFSAPLIANGRVFIGGASQLIVYGLLP